MTLSAPQMVAEKTTTRSRRLVHIRELDGVRGIAALIVFFHHICFASINPAGWGAPVRFLYTISQPGNSGVDLFFVLSGFLITSLLIQARKTSSYYHDFYWKRVLRILPLYIVCLLGVFFFIPGSGKYVLMSVFFVSNFAWIFHVSSVGPFWTLAIEEQFYLLWPTVVRRRSVDELRHWAIGIGITAVILRFIAAIFGHYDYYFTFFHCDGLAFGALLGCWFYQRDATETNVARESRLMYLGFLLGGFFLGLSLLPGTQLRFIAFLAAFHQTGITLLYGTFIALLISRTGQRSFAFLRSPLLTFFGLISYAMYMIHAYVMMLYDHLRAPMQSGDNTAYFVRLLVIFGGTIALSLLSRYLIELPAISLRKYVLTRSEPLSPSDPPVPLGNM
jgi:peptidoglycan/LPS O-acetylase OafA/YrhL